ncbi:MAG: M64 family metallopeptidase [Candidatus Diapherotrites archaeon]|nr:M64 family metallopeptidase [Candidatus Diapherotrites archaeon]
MQAKHFAILLILGLTILITLSGCTKPPACGDGVCETGLENETNCQTDCQASNPDNPENAGPANPNPAEVSSQEINFISSLSVQTKANTAILLPNTFFIISSNDYNQLFRQACPTGYVAVGSFKPDSIPNNQQYPTAFDIYQGQLKSGWLTLCTKTPKKNFLLISVDTYGKVQRKQCPEFGLQVKGRWKPQYSTSSITGIDKLPTGESRSIMNGWMDLCSEDLITVIGLDAFSTRVETCPSDKPISAGAFKPQSVPNNPSTPTGNDVHGHRISNGWLVSCSARPLENPCRDLIPGQNNSSENRINVVFIGFGYNNDLNNFIRITRRLLQQGEDGFGSIEPYASNLSRFNFYYTPLTPFEGYFDNISGSIVPNQRALARVDELESGCRFRAGLNVQRIGLSSNFIGSHAGLNSGDSWSYYPNNPEYMDLRTVVHEVGHSFGGLFDERDSFEGMSAGGNPNGENRNCFSASSQSNCIRDSNWADLVGNGCGQDGVIDCNESNPNKILEVGCFSGCSYNNFYRPTWNSLMGFTSNTSNLGQVNQRILCRLIKEKTGSVGGICNSLCINGCNAGKKCIQGECR